MLDQLYAQGRIWQNHRSGNIPAIDTGYAALNQHLPGGGWPADGITEIIYPHLGIGELSLLLPCLKHLSQQEQWQAWIAPPWQPNAAALAAAGVDIRSLLFIWPKNINKRLDHRSHHAHNHRKNNNKQHDKDILWALEESLKSGAVNAVLGWAQNITPPQARRLQMCASQYQVPCFLFKQQTDNATSQATPCTLRLHITAQGHDCLDITILKQRHGWPPPPFSLNVKRYSPFRYLSQ